MQKSTDTSREFGNNFFINFFQCLTIVKGWEAVGDGGVAPYSRWMSYNNSIIVNEYVNYRYTGKFVEPFY